MCAERHKSPSRIRMGSARNEPDIHGQRNQTKTQTKNPNTNNQEQNKQPRNQTGQALFRTSLKSKRCGSEDQHRSETGR